MENMDLKKYLDVVKKERQAFFKSSLERAYDCFMDLGYDKKDCNFFICNASQIIETLREACWNEFIFEEKKFTVYMLNKLIDEEYFNKYSPKEAIEKFVSIYPEHIYQLNLSNTQSRRSRAGKEFESILELVLMGAGVPMTSQGSIGKDYFETKGLSKMVDAVSPGVVEFEANKRNAILISAKTTLRERWQEVPEEMNRTGAREMFLATLDDSISADVLKTLYESNIQVTTTKQIKENKYSNNNRVLTFEQLLEICVENANYWKEYKYSDTQVQQALDSIDKELKKHEGYTFIRESLLERMKLYKSKVKKI